jgi:hypothetical protein
MKKILIILLILLFPAWAGATITNKNMLSNLYYSGDSNYLYGRSVASLTQVVKRAIDGTTTNGSNLAGYTGISVIVSTETDGLIFAVVYNASGQYFLLKSIDGGSNFGDNSPTFDDGDSVLKLGDDGGTHTANVRLLGDMGFCDTGSKLLLAEYNIAGSRTAGGENDRVRLMQSLDDGSTWSEVITFNRQQWSREWRNARIVMGQK